MIRRAKIITYGRPIGKEDYYVPEIEELHVGFECEFQGVDCNWTPNGWDKETVVITPKEKKVGVWQLDFDVINFVYHEGDVSNTLRVKYLDREDIESFGFELDQCTKDGCVFYKGNLMTKEEWCLIFGGKTNPKNYLSITSMKNNPNSFTGTAKNKSELKRILKQLEILC
jgi:hypothetical protein